MLQSPPLMLIKSRGVICNIENARYAMTPQSYNVSPLRGDVPLFIKCVRDCALDFQSCVCTFVLVAILFGAWFGVHRPSVKEIFRQLLRPWVRLFSSMDICGEVTSIKQPISYFFVRPNDHLINEFNGVWKIVRFQGQSSLTDIHSIKLFVGSFFCC